LPLSSVAMPVASWIASGPDSDCFDCPNSSRGSTSSSGIATLLSGKAGPLDFAREAVGMDVLRIEGETAEEATVTVGRNIGDGVFLGARQGLQGQGTTVMVEVDVFGGVKVDSEITQEGSSNVGITWRKDF
jgi:autotransporter translocation and assembly factor TamB